MPATPDPLHRVPRRPWAWWLVFVASQAGVAVLWWQAGWMWGLPALAASHLAIVGGALWPRSPLAGPVLSRLPVLDRRVWLTIDDGPSDDTLAILDLLAAHGARATFFLVGDRAAARPELVREIVRRGHGVGNHSASHPAAWFWALPPRAMAREIGQAQRSLQAITGHAPRWFRAVVGMANPFVARELQAHGLARVAWSARGYDGVAGDVEAVVARIARDLRPGAIVLLHEGARHGHNVASLARLLQVLDARGYTTLLPEDLLPATHAPRAADVLAATRLSPDAARPPASC